MPAIPIDVDDEEAVDPAEIRRQPTRAIPLPGARPIPIVAGPRKALPVPSAAENPMEIPSGVIGSTSRQVIPIGAAPRPQVMGSGGIPTTPQTPRSIIPTNPVTGEAEQVNNKGIPIKAGIAGLWAKADNIHNPVLRVLGKIGTGALKAIDYAGEAALPSVEQRIPGSEGNERLQENRKLSVDKEQAETEAKTAQTAHTNAETDALQAKPDQPTDKPIHSYVNAEGKQVTIFQKADNSTYEKTFGDVNQKDPAAKTPSDFEQFYADYIKDNNIHDSAHNRLMARKAYAAAGQAPQREPRQLAVGPDGTVIELKPGMKIPQGSKTMAGDLAGPKVSADEQKRADLVENLNENLDQLEEIVKRRPELFGKMAGRATKFREWTGSDDPDVASLKGIEDRLGMVQQSSHGMRSAQHVAASADSVINGYKNGPEAMLKSIADARKSGETFTKDAQRGKSEATGEQWSAPKDAPAAPAEDGHQLKKDGKVLAVSKGGKWARP